MRDLVDFIAKSLVDDPESVRVRTHERDRETFIELEVAQPDLGKVIGRQGRTARAIRTLLQAAGHR
jgi:predicted RNA-binding protein YlqC (UPF0109 family)